MVTRNNLQVSSETHIYAHFNVQPYKKILMDQFASQSVDTTFMEDVVLLFGICAVIVIGANRKFCIVFEEALQLLNISVCPLA